MPGAQSDTTPLRSSGSGRGRARVTAADQAHEWLRPTVSGSLGRREPGAIERMEGSAAQTWIQEPAQDLRVARMFPDYQGGSIVNLMSSIIAACGGVPARGYPVLPMPGAGDSIARCRKIVLMVIDGLGHEVLCRHAAGGALHQRLHGSMTSVFPSTTAAAITSFLTGVAPQQHGLTGWFLYLRELAGVYAVLSGKPRCGGVNFSRAGIEPRVIFDTPPVFDGLPVDSIIVTPRRIGESDYNVAHRGKADLRVYDSLDDFFLMTARAVREPVAGRQFIYAYWPDLDSLGHEYGIDSRESVSHLAQIDERFGCFCRQLSGSDTLLIATADHGMIDTRAEFAIDLADHPTLSDCLVLPLCGERRAAYCYVRPDRCGLFESYVAAELGHSATCVRSSELLARGVYGLGEPHPRLAERIGDYVLLMKDRYVIGDWLPGESRYQHIGVHGGVSAAEMIVPLVLAAL